MAPRADPIVIQTEEELVDVFTATFGLTREEAQAKVDRVKNWRPDLVPPPPKTDPRGWLRP